MINSYNTTAMGLNQFAFLRAFGRGFPSQIEPPTECFFNSMKEEIWRDIPWYEGYYQISNNLRLKSIDRVVLIKWVKTSIKWRILKLRINENGYSKCTFSVKWKEKKAYLHQLVMLIKEWPCPPWKEVCHNDWNPRNNHPDNLRYGTRHENNMDAIKHGTFYDIRLVSTRSDKSCSFSYQWETKQFPSAKDMARYLWIKYHVCTLLLRKKVPKKWPFIWYTFSYLMNSSRSSLI